MEWVEEKVFWACHRVSHTSRNTWPKMYFSESLESGMELTPTISLPSNQSSSFLTIHLCKYQEDFWGEGLGLG
ncbi:hypothetical protein HanRHA438_Chr06g0267891 [Helianthus annuus]|nr:hypothetical protein HanRHA438_Chr06g0267891 [Helianthus annuus]